MSRLHGFGWPSPEQLDEAEAFFEELLGVRDQDPWREAEAFASDAPLEVTWTERIDNESVLGREAEAAVTPFSAAERANLGPLLPARANHDALASNLREHPRRSNVEPASIRAAVELYVDLDAVRQAIAAHDQANSSSPIARGTPPFDAVLVEAMHQFQRKCYFETERIHGRVDGTTLDSLGFVKDRARRGLHRANPKAKRRLQRVPTAQLTNDEFTANNWFEHIISPSFLGHTFTNGVHLMLVRRLRLAERWLLTSQGLQGSTPVALGLALGFSPRWEQHKGSRPGRVQSSSFHTFGLATDIRYRGNPFIRTDAFYAAFKRAALLVRGERFPDRTINLYLHRRASEGHSTARLYYILRRHNDDFTEYLRLRHDPDRIAAKLRERREWGHHAAFRGNETIEQATRRWRARIVQDLAAMRSAGSPFQLGKSAGFRNPELGFLNMPEALVVALRDHACLAWGAFDLGPSNNGAGDVMHFDMRRCGLGYRLATTNNGQHRTIIRHPCGPCRARLLAREIGQSTTRLSQVPGAGRPLHSGFAPGPPRETLYVEIVLGSESPAKPMTGIYVPERYRLPRSRRVDMIVYLHGHKKGMRNFANDMSIDSYWNRAEVDSLFPLREALDQTGRNVILVAPTLGHTSRAGSLVHANGLDWYLDQVLEALRSHGPLGRDALHLGTLILAAHSGGGSVMRKLATSSSPCTANLKECWAFDAMYDAVGSQQWARWASWATDSKLYVHYRDVPGKPRTYGRELARATHGSNNVSVQGSSSTDHFGIVMAHWTDRILSATGINLSPGATR